MKVPNRLHNLSPCFWTSIARCFFCELAYCKHGQLSKTTQYRVHFLGKTTNYWCVNSGVQKYRHALALRNEKHGVHKHFLKLLYVYYY